MLCRFSGIVCGVIFASVSAWGQYVISTVAGMGPGSAGYAGDSGPATSAELNSPTGILYTGGKLYIADSNNHCVRVVSAGTITTFAGVCGTPGFFGDGGQANLANLNNPSALAVDQNGDILIADTSNNVVRIVVPSGIISTFAGDQSAGLGYTGDGGPATAGLLTSPTALAVDSAGNVYINDPVHNVIRKVNSGTGDFSTAVGTGASSGILASPNGIAVDAAFSVYISDTSHRVFKFANNTLTVLAGNGNIGYGGDNGPAVKALLNHPIGLSVDSAGNVYITDSTESRVRLVSPNGIITTIAGSGQFGYSGNGGPALNANLYFPHTTVLDGAGNLYLSDTGNNVIRKLTLPAPTITANMVVNSASYVAQVSPGSLASIFGSSLATSTPPQASPQLPTALGEATVTVNGKLAPILYASPTQINFQVPWETSIGTASVVVTVGTTASNTVTVPVTATAPGIYNNAGVAIAQNYTAAAGYTLNSSTNPAHAGGALIAYLTGSGPVSPAVADGAAAPTTGLVQTPSLPTVTIGGQPALVQFSGLTPGLIPLWQLNLTVPSGLAAGSYPLIVSYGGQTSVSATVSVAP